MTRAGLWLLSGVVRGALPAVTLMLGVCLSAPALASSMPDDAFDLPELTGADHEALEEAARMQDAIRHLAPFVRHMWGILHPGRPLVWGPHMDVVCDALERVTSGEVQDLVICIPPRHAKSLMVSVFWPAWVWLNKPGHQWLAISKSESVAKRDSRRMRKVIKSARYRDLMMIVATEAARARGEDIDEIDLWGFELDQNTKQNFENTQGGHRICKPIKADIIGEGGDTIIIDDPHDVKDIILGSPAMVSKRLAEVVYTYDQVLESRRNDPLTSSRVVIMQRLHRNDLAGTLMARGVESVVLPSEYDPLHPNACPWDFRTEPGQLLEPTRFPLSVLEAKRVSLGVRQYAAQQNQRPTPGEGNLFKTAWFTQRYDEDPLRLRCDEYLISLDCTFKKGDETDFVVFQVWGWRRDVKKWGETCGFYLLDQIRGRMNYPETRQHLIDLTAKWPQVYTKLIEDKANGPALLADLQGAVLGLTPFNPGSASKYERAQVGSVPAFRAMDVYLPTAAWCPWIGGYVIEHTDFAPGATADDQVDATSQALIMWRLGVTNYSDVLNDQLGFLDEGYV